MDVKFTNRSWRVHSHFPNRIEVSGVCDVVDGPVYSTIAIFSDTIQMDTDGRDWGCGGTKEGNARLASASVELFWACKKLLAFAESVRPGGGVLNGEEEMFKDARAAILKAEGGKGVSGTHPKPWAAHEAPKTAHYQWTVLGASGAVVAIGMNEADAREIVAAVNSHSDLLAALVWIVAEFRPVASDNGPRERALDAALCAISKAGGTT